MATTQLAIFRIFLKNSDDKSPLLGNTYIYYNMLDVKIRKRNSSHEQKYIEQKYVSKFFQNT